MLFIMVDMLYIAIPALLFAKKFWSSLIICLFLFMAEGSYIFLSILIILIDHLIIKHFSHFLLAKPK